MSVKKEIKMDLEDEMAEHLHQVGKEVIVANFLIYFKEIFQVTEYNLIC